MLENVGFGTIIYPRFTCSLCKCCSRDNIIEFALHESVLTPESVAEITLMGNINKIKQIRLSLVMKIELYSLTETPSEMVDAQETELGYEIRDKEQLKIACEG